MKGTKGTRAYAEQFFNPPVVPGQNAGSSLARIAAEAQAAREKSERLKTQRLAAQAAEGNAADRANRKMRTRRAILSD